MHEFDVFQVGGRLWSLRKLLKSNQEFDSLTRQYLGLDLVRSTVAVKHLIGERSRTPDANSDTAFIARVLLGLLQRGHSAIVSPFVETGIINGTLPSTEMCTEVDHHLPLEDVDPVTFVRDVLVHYVSAETSVSPDWSSQFDSESERRFFEESLTDLLGPGISLVEAQRSLDTMVLNSDQFVGQRVDFALETPTGTKVVFEIDGRQHQYEYEFDRRRDMALQRAGWIVERIPAGHLWDGRRIFSRRIREHIERDATLGMLRDAAGVPGQDIHSDLAFRVAIAPHAVSRVQLAILLAMLNGELSLDQPDWVIGVVERDLACAELAVHDLISQIGQLSAIYGIYCHLRVQLVIAPVYIGSQLATPTDSRCGRVSTRYVAGSDFVSEGLQLDVIIDASVRRRPADVWLLDPVSVHDLNGHVPIYELCSAYRRAPECFISWPDLRPVTSGNLARLDEPLQYFLRMLFRKPDFKIRQLDIIKRAMQRRDVLGLLPTGGGKSLTFQLATLLSPGVAIVVAPLKSLIDDQWDNLHRAGINRVEAIHSGHSAKEKNHKLQEIARGYPRFVYVSPERFQSKRFREDIQESPISRSIAFVVIDEAHCVSEWGHNFRPAYLSVSRQTRSLFRSGTETPPIIALTATASSTVLTDIVRELEFDSEDEAAIISVSNFDRKELRFLPFIGSPVTKKRDLERALDMISGALGMVSAELLNMPSQAGIVFCRYVNGEFGAVGVSEYIQRTIRAGSRQVDLYAGSRPKRWSSEQDWEQHKKSVQKSFKEDEFSLLVTTSSFGMGIDKQNIRYTIHYGIPPSLEALAQESGRAGRDGVESYCAIVYTREDLSPENDYLTPEIDTEVARQRAKRITRTQQGDTSRLMFLHGETFPGFERESLSLKRVFGELSSAWGRQHMSRTEPSLISITRPNQEKESKRVDKALYRLSVLGVIVDYTIDYNAQRAEVIAIPVTPQEMEDNLRAFVRRYDATERFERILGEAVNTLDPSNPYDHLLRAICQFSYEVIERSRREAMKRVVDVLRDTNEDGQALAVKLNEYLSTNTFTGLVASITRRVEVETWFSILEKAFNPALATQLVNAAERELESNPTHPGLHILAGLGNIHRDSVAPRSIAARLITGLRYFESNYNQAPEERRRLSRKVVDTIVKIRPDRFESIVAVLVGEFADEYTAIAAYPHVSSSTLRRKCAVPWLRQARDIARSLRGETLETMR